MKICLISDYLRGVHSIWSGAEIVCERLADALEKKGHEIIYLTTYGDHNVKLTIQSEKINDLNRKIFLIKTPFINFGVWKHILPFDIFCFFYALVILKKIKPDILHFHAKTLFLPVMIAAKILKIRTVYTVVDYNLVCQNNTLRKIDGSICEDLQGKACYKCTAPHLASSKNIFKKIIIKILIYRRKIIYDYMIKEINAVIAFTKTSAEKLFKYGINTNKISILYQYELPVIKTANIPKHYFTTPTILFLGALHEHKGLAIVVEAMKEIVKEIPKAKLLVIGSAWNDSYISKVNSLIEKYNIKSNVIFLGQTENNEVMEFLKRTDVVVVPEQWPSDFGPIILIEALALGKAVVASRIGAAPEFIKDGVSGYLVTHDKPDEFAKKIINLLNDRHLATEFAKNAMESTRFVRDDSLSQNIISIYRAILEK